MINHFVPKNLAEALKILNEHNCYIMNGGTDLMVQKHVSTGLLPNFDKDVLYINNLQELNYINVDKDKNVHIGSTTRYVQIENSNLVPSIYKDVIKEIASPNIRNMATLSGNIANASPAGDSLVPLVLLDAKVLLVSVNGEREELVRDFVIGVRKIDRKENELIKEVILPPFDLKLSYRKVGSRKSESITKVSFLGGVKVEKGIIKDFRIAFGSVAIKTVRNLEVEHKYIGKKYSEIDVEEVVKDYSPLVTPITDQRSNKEYRHKVAMNLLKKFVNEIKEGGFNE